MITQVSSTKEKSFKVLDSLTVGIKEEENYFSLPTEVVFSMAARNNPKRSYLFVSKLIGKHIPVRPGTPFIAGFLLASRLAQTLGLPVVNHQISAFVDTLVLDRAGQLPAVNGPYQTFRSPNNVKKHQPYKPYQPYHLPGRALFIGFAETATALGHAVFSCFAGRHRYLHTTRENLAGSYDTLFFTEAHCHAPEQRCLISDASLVEGNDLLVLIDDEITSGNTCLDIIKTIQGKYPQKKYVVLTILDWRSNRAMQNYSQLEKELGVPIEVLALIKGSFWSRGTSPVLDSPLAVASCASGPAGAVRMLHLPMGVTVHAEVAGSGGTRAGYLGSTGRFGLDEQQNNLLHDQARALGQKLARQRQGKRTLCLGTGEFMYIPFLVAGFMGAGVWVQSTTRSPVHPHLRDDYAVKYAITFEDPFRPGVPNYVYNIPPRIYDEVFVFWERQVLPRQVAPLVQALQQAGIPNITFVIFCS